MFLALKDYGNLGWELVSDYEIEENQTYSLSSFGISNYGRNLDWETPIDKKNAKYNEILDYLDQNYEDCSVVGCIPWTFNGTTQRFEILFETKSSTSYRKFSFKRPVS